MTTSLWMVREANLVGNTILFDKVFKDSITKMFTPITNDSFGGSKTREDMLFEKLDHNSMVIGAESNCLDPFGNIVNSN